jgi:hypothetical protein
MKTDLTFNIDTEFESLSYNRDSDSWTFVFSENVYATSTGFWRLLKETSILFVSFDHGHQFGLQKAIDLTARVTEVLNAKNLSRIHVDKNTGDLTLTLTNRLELQIFTTSTGYESYDLQVYNKRYIGLGGGDIEIIENE